MDEPRAWIALRAKELRKTQTRHEIKLWAQLRAKRFAAFKFRRQVPIGKFIVDFVCFERRLIVELDGGQHSDQQIYDLGRDAWLKSQDFRVIRFWNSEVDNCFDDVLEAIFRELNSPSP